MADADEAGGVAVRLMWPLRPRTVKNVIRRRKIAMLLHSTHLYRNLPQILESGSIESAGRLIERFGREKAARYLHDPNRYEQFAVGLDYVNCSLSVPNVELLYRRSRTDWQREWVHLGLSLSLLYKEGTRYSPVSAAEDRGAFVGQGVAAFTSLFDEDVHGTKRERELPLSVPTHPQAEVLIRGPVSLSDIDRVIVATAQDQLEVERLCMQYRRNLKVAVAQQLFVWPERLVRR